MLGLAAPAGYRWLERREQLIDEDLIGRDRARLKHDDLGLVPRTIQLFINDPLHAKATRRADGTVAQEVKNWTPINMVLNLGKGYMRRREFHQRGCWLCSRKPKLT